MWIMGATAVSRYRFALPFCGGALCALAPIWSDRADLVAGVFIKQAVQHILKTADRGAARIAECRGESFALNRS